MACIGVVVGGAETSVCFFAPEIQFGLKLGPIASKGITDSTTKGLGFCSLLVIAAGMQQQGKLVPSTFM